MAPNDARYLEIVLEPIRICARYKPRFGQRGAGGGLTFAQFQKLYQADAFYSWFGLDNPLMYAAHRAAGGMTSVYRQIGIGCERLFREILKDALHLTSEDVTWSYDSPPLGGKARTLYLDGRVPLDRIGDKGRREGIRSWMREAAGTLGVEARVFETLTGIVFEVRQGYKSKDSKRQNADIANAAAAYTKAMLPCAVILSAQIDGDVLSRYRLARWAVLTGVEGLDDPLLSSYDFMRYVIGYDLAAFFRRNSMTLRAEVEAVMKALLTPEAK